MKEIIDWIISLALAIVVALILRSFVFSTTYVKGDSMYPTLHEKDILISNKISKHIENVSRGDIVIVKAPDSNKDYIKRVIAREGDSIEIKDGKVYLNGAELIEPYINGDTFLSYGKEGKWEVPDDTIFVLGDNREYSNDSRDFGYIKVSDIKGIAIFRIFPFNRVGRLDRF